MTDKQHILCIEDDEDNAKAITSVLSHYGYEVRHFSNPEEALASIGEFKPALAILDIILPLMDGFTIATKLRESIPNLPILFMTADPTRETRQKLGEWQAPYLIKPFSPKALQEKLKQLLPQ